MRLPTRLLAILFAMLIATIAIAEDRYLKAFPPAGEGKVRYVVMLPHKERGEDENFQVEIIVGKEMLTDGINQVRFSGAIQAKPLEGWGFTYYEVDKLGPPAQTLIGVPPGTPQVSKFVTVPGLKISYNSRVPLVVYVPAGAEVRYRIWKADDKTEKADKG